MLTKRRGIGLAAAAVLALAIATAGASAQSSPQVVASGLDSPRHLTFSADGELYVVEAAEEAQFSVASRTRHSVPRVSASPVRSRWFETRTPTSVS